MHVMHQKTGASSRWGCRWRHSPYVCRM